MKKLLAVLACAGASPAADLLVGAASDLAPLVPALKEGWTASGGGRVVFTLASSGSLLRQIENGAPFDVFLSASEQYVRELVATGRAEASTVTIYGVGRIALWSAGGSAQALADIARPAVKHVAIANPEHAPYGVAARQALERQGLWAAVLPKVIYGENVRQALQFAESRNADAVITSWTLLRNRGVLLPAEWHDPIRQAGVVVKSSSQPQAAKAFLAFLDSPAGRRILQDGGLFPPPGAVSSAPGSPASVPPPRPPSAIRRFAPQ
jgi:molybdate transport system substrate-binding protein